MLRKLSDWGVMAREEKGGMMIWRGVIIWILHRGIVVVWGEIGYVI